MKKMQEIALKAEGEDKERFFILRAPKCSKLLQVKDLSHIIDKYYNPLERWSTGLNIETVKSIVEAAQQSEKFTLFATGHTHQYGTQGETKHYNLLRPSGTRIKETKSDFLPFIRMTSSDGTQTIGSHAMFISSRPGFSFYQSFKRNTENNQFYERSRSYKMFNLQGKPY